MVGRWTMDDGRWPPTCRCPEQPPWTTTSTNTCTRCAQSGDVSHETDPRRWLPAGQGRPNSSSFRPEAHRPAPWHKSVPRPRPCRCLCALPATASPTHRFLGRRDRYPVPGPLGGAPRVFQAEPVTTARAAAAAAREAATAAAAAAWATGDGGAEQLFSC